VFWKPVYYLLEDEFQCWLLNARHLRNVPGRKTDVADAAWICQLVEHGLVRPSFVPPKPIRRLRDLTRFRKALIHERTRESQRLAKVLEDAGIKLACVASDTLGVSGRAMLEALVAGTTDPPGPRRTGARAAPQEAAVAARGPSAITTCLVGKRSAGGRGSQLASGIRAGGRGRFVALYSPPLSKHNHHRHDGVSNKDHHHADGKALEVEPTVVVGLHGITEQAGEQEHERVADDPPPRKPPPAPGKIHEEGL
jgi:Transposase